MLSACPSSRGGDVEELFGLVQGVEVGAAALGQRGDQARHPSRAAEAQAPGHGDAGADPDRPGPPELSKGPHARVAVLGGLARSHQADLPVTSVRAVLDAQLQVEAESETQRVEARPEVGRRGGHPHDHDGSAWPIGLEGRYASSSVGDREPLRPDRRPARWPRAATPASRLDVAPPTSSAAAAFKHHDVAVGTPLAGKTRRARSAFLAGSPPRRSSGWARGTPRSAGSSTDVVMTPPRSSRTVEGRGGRDSSSPSWPCTSMTCSAPWACSTASIRSAISASATPRSIRRTRRRVGHRAEDVEHGRDADLSSGRSGVAERRVEPRGQAEADARLLDAASHAGGRQLDHHPEGFQQVGRAALRRRGTVAVLAHRHPGAGHDEGGQGRDVDAVAAVAAGADDVDRPVGQIRRAATPGGPRRAWRRACRSARRRFRPSCAGPRRTLPSWAGVASPARISSMAARAVSELRSRPEPAGGGPRANRRCRPDDPSGSSSGRAAALADDPPALPLGGAAPDALLLAALERVLEASGAYAAAAAHGLGAVRLLVGLGIEDPGVEAPARPSCRQSISFTGTGRPPRRVEGRWIGRRCIVEAQIGCD